MTTIGISKEEVEESKEITRELDSYKTYNKFNCNNNYLGVLGEMVFDRYLSENSVEHQWVPFIKSNWESSNIFKHPDFIINGKTIDIKTTYSKGLWFQRPTHDIYIHAQVSTDNNFLLLSGFLTRDMMLKAIEDGTAKEVVRGNRTDYVIDSSYLIPFNWFKFIIKSVN